MSFTAKIEADISKWSGNLEKAERESKSFANSVASDVNKVNKSFDKINGNSIGGLNNRLAALKKNLESATDVQSIVKYNIRIQQTQNEIERLKNLGLQASNATQSIGGSLQAASIDKFSSAMRRSNTVAMEFNRIIQDAPFGMMGISNNLTQLTDNYKNYAAQVRAAAAEQGRSISNFQIFKGAVAGIFSPLNLFSLGLSAVTSGLIIYQQWQQRSAKRTKETTDKLQELVDGLSNVSTAMYKGAQSSGHEVAQLNVLYAISQDVTKSTDARRRAANDLIKQYPALFGKFTTEQVMLGKAKTAYDEVSKSILATARAQAAYGMISEKFAKQLAIEETNRALERQIVDIENLIDVERERYEQAVKSVRAAGAAGTGFSSASIASREASLQEKIVSLSDQKNKNLKEYHSLQSEIIELEKFAITNQSQTIKLDEDTDKGTKKKTKSLSEYRKELVDTLASWGIYEAKMESLNTKFGDIAVLAKKAGASLSELQIIANRQWAETAILQFERLGDTIGKSVGVTGLSKGFTIPTIVKVDADFTQLNEKLSKLKSDLKGFLEIDLQNVVGNTVSTMMSAVGDALANGGNVLDQIGAGIIKSLGGLAKSIGEQMIAFGVAGIALKKLMMNPYLALAAGAALVALGSFAQSSVSRQTSQFNGTNASANIGSQVTNDYSNWRGALYNNDKQVVELKLKNTELTGVLELSNTRNKRLS